MIARRPVYVELHRQLVQFRLSHLRWPPQARIRNDQLGEFVGREGHILRFIGSKLYILVEVNVLNSAFQLPLHRLIGAVLDLRRHR